MDEQKLKQYDFFKKLCAVPVIERIILYGSRARGDALQRSDIDMAISCPLATEREWQEILEIIAAADTLLKIDCVRFDPLREDNPLKKEIIKDGLELFRRVS